MPCIKELLIKEAKQGMVAGADNLNNMLFILSSPDEDLLSRLSMIFCTSHSVTGYRKPTAQPD